jgi:uncharacterized repeat protein (TIGR01451 family)
MSKERTTMVQTTITAERRFPRRRLVLLGGLVLALAFWLAPASPAAANVIYDIKTVWGPTEMRPGGEGMFSVRVRNVGSTGTIGAIKVTDHLPPGVSVKEQFSTEGWYCWGTSTLICKTAHELGSWSSSFFNERLQFTVTVDPSVSGVHDNVATISGGGGEERSDVNPIVFGEGEEHFGLIPSSVEGDAFSQEHPLPGYERQAGTHPFETRFYFDFNEYYSHAPEVAQNPGAPFTKPVGRVRTIETILPRGLIGTNEATPKCTGTEFLGAGQEFFQGAGCRPDSQVGYMKVMLSNGWDEGGWGFLNEVPRVALYNLVPPKGVAADIGYKIGQIAIGHIFLTLDSAHDYALKATAPYINDIEAVRGVQFVLWGVPGDPAHNERRTTFAHFTPEGKPDYEYPAWGAEVKPPYRPYITLPMDCGVGNGPIWQSVESWNNPGEFTQPLPGKTELNVSGCEDQRVRFHPKITMQPTDRSADTPTGLDVHLEVPQRKQEVEFANELYNQSGNEHAIDTPPMKKVVVTFPEGMTISTSAAQGLGVCTSAEIGLGTDSPVTCPDNSQYGQLTLHTPLLPPDEPMRGWIYIAKKGDNPYHNFLSMYFVIQEPERGLLIKIPGKIDLDPVTGQIKVTFEDLPQFPVSDMQLTYKGGVRTALTNPPTCGTKTITAVFYSWAHPEEPNTVTDSYKITHKADGSPCVNNLAERPFKPEMSVGTVNPNAASYSPFIFRMTRTDDEQELSQIGVQMPPGLTAKIAGITECSDEALEEAANPLRTGTEEKEHPSCPASSQIGTTDVGSGIGVPLTFFPGRVYLAGPYEGAPLSIAVISPVLPGPYDLGVIVVRSAVEVNPETTAIHVLSDPFPQIYQGIPVRIRDIRLKIDRPETMLNPTNCNPMSIAAHLTGAGGDVNTTADDTAYDTETNFQVANCLRLGFAPKLSFTLNGGTGRDDHPGLTATLVTHPGEANIAHVSVTLPHSEFLDQSHINTICTRVQFDAEECPPGSVYGRAEVWTPLLDKPLEGPVILRSSSHQLPDLVMELKGAVDVNLVGRIDSINEGIRTTFETIPDQPVSRFELSLQGAGKGLLVNSTNLCTTNQPATVQIDGQNGMTADQSPHLKDSCGKAHRRHKARRHHRHARRHHRHARRHHARHIRSSRR